MRPSLPLLLPVLLAGCAAAAPARPAPPRAPEIAEIFTGVPPTVIAGRAVAELESGDPGRREGARRTLRALPPEALAPWAGRALAAPRGAVERMDCLEVLSDRGETPADVDLSETVALSLRTLSREGSEPRDRLLALERLRDLGAGAEEPLRAVLAAGGPTAPAAGRALRALGFPDRHLPFSRP